jgi:tetratricopeptide (TPR) repeat protein
MQIDPRHDHSLRVPRPDLSVKLDIPNACNNCHTTKTARWAAAAVLKWLGRNAVGYQRFDDAFAAALRGALEARGELIAIIEDKEQSPIARASALNRFERWLTASTLPKVTGALNDGEPIVRLAAVDALSNATVETRQRYLARMLQDPVRAVRIEAAHALAGPAAYSLPAADRTFFERAIDEYIAVQTYNADRPEARTNLADLYALRGDAERAAAHYRKAIDLDSTFIPAYANLADFYRDRGMEGEAEATLRSGLVRNPNAAALHHALGLALIRQKRTAEALVELGEAVKIDAANPRYAYAYAVQQNDSGQPREALQTLAVANRRNPYDNDVLAGLAQYSAATGDWDAALRYVRRLQALDPDNAEYARLGAKIQRQTVTTPTLR